MPRKTDEIDSEGWIGNKPDEYEGVKFPAGVDKTQIGTGTGQWYAYHRTYKDGTKEVQWFKRGAGGGEGGRGDAVETTTEYVVADVRKEWDAAAAKAATAPPANVTVDINPASGKPSQKSTYPDGHVTWDDTAVPASAAKPETEWHTEGTPDGQGGFDNSRPVMVRTVNGNRQERAPTAAELKDWNQAGQISRNPGGKTDAEIKADADKADATARQTRQDEEARAAHAAAEGRAQSQEGRAAAAAAPKDTPRAVTINGKRVVEHTITGTPEKPGQVYWTDEAGNRIAPPEEGAGPTPAGVRPYTPDPSQDDWGLASYDEYLQGLRRQGIIDRAQGAELLQRAGSSAQVAEARGVRRERAAETATGHRITEQAGLRSSAGHALDTAYANYAAPIAPEDAGIATRAFLASLGMAQANARQWGGMPGSGTPGGTRMGPEAGQFWTPGGTPGMPVDPDRYTTATQIALHPGGGVEISPPGAAPQGTAPAGVPAPAGPPVRDDWRSNPGAAPINPPVGEPGNNPNAPVGMGAPPAPYLAAMGAGSPQPPAFQPDLAALRAQGFNDAEIQQAWTEHQQEMGA